MLYDSLRRLAGVVVRSLKKAKAVVGVYHVWVSLLTGEVESRRVRIQSRNLLVHVLQLLIAECCEECAGHALDFLRLVGIAQNGHALVEFHKIVLVRWLAVSSAREGTISVEMDSSGPVRDHALLLR